MAVGASHSNGRRRRATALVGGSVVGLALVVGLLLAPDRAEPSPARVPPAESGSRAAALPGGIPTPPTDRAPATTSTGPAPTSTTSAASAAETAADPTATTEPAAPPAPPSTLTDDATTADTSDGTVGDAAVAAERHDFGLSLEGQPLVAWRRVGSGQPTRRELVVGVIHGEEPAGRAITDALLTAPLPEGLELWLVPTLNPDGEATGQRGNANGVDLNRNFPTGWLPPGSDPYTSGGYYSGAGPASEPEVQAVMALIRTVRPQRTVWFHQPWDEVICELGHAGAACSDYATRVGRPAGPAGRPGSAIGWQQAEGLGAALVVELAEGPAAPETVQLHAAAVLAAW